ncbi:zinc finger, C2H2 type [Ostertagia ostertagi]
MSSDFGVHQLLMPFDGNQPGPSRMMVGSPADSSPTTDASDLLRLLTEGNGSSHSPKAHLERLLSGVDLPHDITSSPMEVPTTFSMGIDLSMYGDLGCAGALRYEFLEDVKMSEMQLALQISRDTGDSYEGKTCGRREWTNLRTDGYICLDHTGNAGRMVTNMVKCGYCAENRAHPKLARGESYSCGYKPYRCELCKYSTTTKGNLSIHMQSCTNILMLSKELPSSIGKTFRVTERPFPCPPARSPPSDGDRSLVCVVCGMLL